MKSVELTFKGMDSWDRPVYVDSNGRIWKDVDPRRGIAPSLFSSVDDSFDGEPDCPFHGDPVFIPGRVVWGKGNKVSIE